jgi:hypothetical protein
MSLEAKIELLTAAVIELTAAIGGMQAPGPEGMRIKTITVDGGATYVSATEKNLTETEAEKKPRESEKSKPTSNTSESSSPESKPVTYDDVKRATNAVSKISRDKAIAGLARFGVQSATKLAEGQWSGYVEYMTKVAAGEVDPEASHE